MCREPYRASSRRASDGRRTGQVGLLLFHDRRRRRLIEERQELLNGLKAAAGTIRGDFSSSRQMNLVHASDGPEAAVREIDLYFSADEICEYVPVLTPWMRAGDE